MWWTAAKIAAAVGATLLVLLFVLLLIMVTRPAVVAGVSGDDLARSLSGGSPGAACKKANGDWRCAVEGNRGDVTYGLDVNWMGCWTSEKLVGRGAPRKVRQSGCISLDDLFPINDDS